MLRRYGRTDDVIVASFLDSATDSFSAFAPEVATSAGTLAVAAFYQAVQAGETPAPMRHVALQVPASFGDLPLVDERFVDVAHEQGLAVHVWTIEEEPEMERLCRLGVDGIITDRPSALTTVLDRLDCAWRPPAMTSAPGGAVRRGSAPAAVRLLAVVGLLLGPELALVGSFRHSPAMLLRFEGGPGSAGELDGRAPITEGGR